MTPLDPLAPDQRAVVSLILQQGSSYDDIAQLLGLPVTAVRSRAHAGLDALAPRNGLPVEITGPLADYLLGQQPERDAEATRGLLAESAPARDWAAGVAGSLADVAPGGLPEIPGVAPGGSPSDGDGNPPEAIQTAAPGAPAAEPAAATKPAAPPPAAGAEPAAPDGPPAPRPRPTRDDATTEDDAPPASSRLGGALLILGVVAVVAVVLFLVLRDGGSDPGDEQAASPSATPAATPTPTATAQAQVADEIDLKAPGGGRATGKMTVFLQGGQLLFALQGQGLPANSGNDSYAVWLTGPGSKARRLGYTDPVGKDGKLGIQGPGQSDLAAFPQLYATYANVVVSRESDENAKRPADVVLSGKLPSGR
jgi:hypothetical protein